jgi:hypothetical protein
VVSAIWGYVMDGLNRCHPESAAFSTEIESLQARVRDVAAHELTSEERAASAALAEAIRALLATSAASEPAS